MFPRVGSLVSDPAHPRVTFDVRYLHFIPASEEYIAARRPA
jgi:hypothetical protein